ncbi:hypothetical protein [Fusobacterium sp. PH5-44]|uniref:hypothetical protein n=1 Tax=unclassified Fusobacterium TaxID=2648384 RepID=UPI003D1B7206
MRKSLILFAIITGTFIYGAKVITYDDLYESRDKLYYLNDTKKLFTGTAVMKFSEDSKREYVVKNGVLIETKEYDTANGPANVREFYLENEKTLIKYYNDAGKLVSEKNYKKDQQDGVTIEYDKNGKVSKKYEKKKKEKNTNYDDMPYELNPYPLGRHDYTLHDHYSIVNDI